MPLEDVENEQADSGPAGSPFRHAIFRQVWIASLFSNFGGLIQSVGAAWLMTSIAGSADYVALVQASMTLPIMLFSLPAGALADNFDRRQMMIAAQVFLFIISVALAAFSYFGGMTPWLLLAFTFLIGTGSAFNGPVWQSLVGEIVPRPDIPQAIAINSMGYNIARSVGPAIGGAIVAAFGAFGAFAINSFSYIGLITVLARWKREVPPRILPPEGMREAMAAGVRYVAMSPTILIVLLRGTIFGVGAVALQALLPLVARDLVNGGAFTFGILLGAFGAGAVAGAMSTARLRGRFSIEVIIRLGFVGFALAAVVCGLSRSMALTVVAMAIAGACWVLSLSSFNTTVQLSSPRWVVGRAVALYQVCTFGGMAFGSWFWGHIAHTQGTDMSLLISGGVLALGAVAGFRLPVPDFQQTNLDPLNTWKQPDIAVEIQPRSGPVVITVEYTIRPEDTLAFIKLMAERKRIRVRDGARRWTLLRDLENAELWLERYHLPTWMEYVRHNHRMTVADAPLREQLLALDHTEGRSRVHRMIERQVGWSSVDMVDKHGTDGWSRHPNAHG